MFNIEFHKRVAGFSLEAKAKLLGYAWPGNVRELSNCLERTIIFIEKDTIGSEDLTLFNEEGSLPLKGHRQITLPTGGIVLDDLERQLITAALKQTGNNKSQAARLLVLTRDTPEVSA